MNRTTSQIQAEIRRLCAERDICILAHSYQSHVITEVADFVGDSFALSVKAQKVPNKTLIMCGVRFMAETAKILSPEKTVILSAPEAGCPMAEQMSREEILAVKREHPDHAVVAYVNTTAELKTIADVCVTSSNAVKIVRSLPNRNIFFIPDENLGRFVAEQVPEKNIILNDGCCPIHAKITAEQILAEKSAHPNALVLTHPECTGEVLALSDMVGSTAEILSYAAQSDRQEFIIVTETGVDYALVRDNPGKRFYFPDPHPCCKDMKLNTLASVLSVLEKEDREVLLPEEVRRKALLPLDRMLELGK